MMPNRGIFRGSTTSVAKAVDSGLYKEGCATHGVPSSMYFVVKQLKAQELHFVVLFFELLKLCATSQSKVSSGCTVVFTRLPRLG